MRTSFIVHLRRPRSSNKHSNKSEILQYATYHARIAADVDTSVELDDVLADPSVNGSSQSGNSVFNG